MFVRPSFGLLLFQLPRTTGQSSTNIVKVPDIIVFLGVSITPYKGAITSIDVAVNRKHEGVRDVYFDKCAPVTPSPESR